MVHREKNEKQLPLTGTGVGQAETSSTPWLRPLSFMPQFIFMSKTCELVCSLPPITTLNKTHCPSARTSYFSYPFTNPPLAPTFASVLKCWELPYVLQMSPVPSVRCSISSQDHHRGKSLTSSMSLNTAFVHVWAFKQKGRSPKVIRTSRMPLVNYQGGTIINREAGWGKVAAQFIMELTEHIHGVIKERLREEKKMHC